MPVDLPKRFTRAWIERNVPTLSRLEADVVIAAMRAKGWTEDELRSRVYSGACGEEWKVESSYDVGSDKGVGLLKCYTHKGTAWVQWTRNDLRIYAYASRQDGDRKQLFQAWNSAGPVP